MRTTNSARCPECKESLGTPEEVVTQNEEQMTLYECNSCEGQWYRSHRG